MLNPFPSLLTYSLFAPTILRLTLGLIFLDIGILKFKKEKGRWIASFDALRLPNPSVFVSAFGLLEILAALSLIFGYYTQIGALVFVLLTALEFTIEWQEEKILRRDIVFYALCFAIAFSLLLTSAGKFAFDTYL